EPELRKREIDTLVFVPEGKLMTVPFAALHDGNDFLIARYAIAVSPGLRLVPAAIANSGDVRALTGAMSQPRKGFPALQFAEEEAQAVRRAFPNRATTPLLNESFKLEHLQREVA